MLTLCSFGRVQSSQDDSLLTKERKGLLDPRGSEDGIFGDASREQQARVKDENEGGSIFDRLTCCRRTLSGKCKHVFCCPEEDSEGAQLQDRPSQNRFSPSHTAGLNFSSSQDRRFAGGPGGADATIRTQAILSNPAVPKLDLSAARNSSNSATSAAAGSHGGAPVSFEEAQTSARSFGEDFDIQPPAPNRRDMERLRALREQKPIPAVAGGNISESTAPIVPSANTWATPPAATRYRYVDVNVSNQRETLATEDLQHGKLGHPHTGSDHIAQGRSISQTILSENDQDYQPAARHVSDVVSGSEPQHSDMPESSPAERPGAGTESAAFGRSASAASFGELQCRGWLQRSRIRLS